MRLRQLLLIILGGVLLLAAGLPLGLLVGLNTGAGRQFAARQINHLLGPEITVSGLGGHFPADIKLASVTVADQNGLWASGQGLELRWRPQALWHHRLHVTGLTAAAIQVLRQPVAARPGPAGGGVNIPGNFSLALDRLSVPVLRLGAAIAGQAIALNVQGAAHLQGTAAGDLTLQARTADGRASYTLAGRIDAAGALALQVHAVEAPDGLLGHYAGPLVHEPLQLAMSLAGPRQNAALNLAVKLGQGELNGAGRLGLAPATPFADIVLQVPALAPFGALAHQNIAGSTRLHLSIARRPDGSDALVLNGDLALTTAPGGWARYIGPAGQFALLATLQGKSYIIQQLAVRGAAFAAAAAGSVAPTGVDLNTHVTLPDVAMLSHGLSGTVSEDSTIIGTAGDFAANALLSGDISAQKIPSGPFSIAINAQHLPRTPQGTITGSGALENAPLLLDAAFARDARGATQLTIHNALWRSLNAQADLSLAPGAIIPTGTATFRLGSLQDFAAFSPVKLRGSAAGTFAYLGASAFKLALTANHLVAVPQCGEINATLDAAGRPQAVALRLQASIARIFAAPARLSLAGVLNLATRAGSLSAFSASWRQLSLNLQGPAAFETRPQLAIRHLSLGVNGGRLGLDGVLAPDLDIRAAAENLPLGLAKMLVPRLAASGTVSASAALSGARLSPAGTVRLQVQHLLLLTGPAAALPPADFVGTASSNGKTVTIGTRLSAGANLQLSATGQVAEQTSGALDLHVSGRTDLRLLDPILAAGGTVVRGVVAADFRLSGQASAPRAAGSLALSHGSVENIGSGLNLTQISAAVQASGRQIDLQNYAATAGHGSITGAGRIDLGQPDLPLDVSINARNATPVASDILTENLDAALRLSGALRGRMALEGTVKILRAEINIPKSLPPSVADLPIRYAGETPPPPPPPPPPIDLDLLISARNQIFVRGDGLFAELGGRLHITGTAATPLPEGGFTLIRGNFSLAGKTLQFSQGNVSFNGDGFTPVLDLEASTVTSSNNATATLVVGGTAAKPTITLTSSPPLPSDEILAQLLFGQTASSLTPFQAASLAAALAQLSGLGGGGSPLDSVRNALGLDELSLSGSGSGPPAVEAGRYVAPGVYVGASQATNGKGTQANVQINLYRELKLQTATGTSGSGGSSSVGLTYQFNY